MAGVCEMDPYLMGAAGEEPDLEQARVPPLLRHLDPGESVLPALAHADTPLSATRYIFVQRFADVESVPVGHALDDGGVALLDLPFAELPMQLDERAALLADDQQAGRVPVQPVRELQKFRLRTARPERLDDAVAHAAAAMDGDPGRLVHYQYGSVLVDDRK